MIEDVRKKGSIVVYSNYEATQIKALRKRFPKLDKKLSEVLDRIKDLCRVFQEAIYHPEFRGSASIKATLPVMTEIGYEDLEIQNGTKAVEAFIRIAKDDLSAREMASLRTHLLAYCKRDTQAMVELHHVALQLAR